MLQGCENHGYGWLLLEWLLDCETLELDELNDDELAELNDDELTELDVEFVWLDEFDDSLADDEDDDDPLDADDAEFVCDDDDEPEEESDDSSSKLKMSTTPLCATSVESVEKSKTDVVRDSPPRTSVRCN